MQSYKSTPKVKELTGSRKHTCYLMTSEHYQVSTGWSGGSRQDFSLINFKSGQPEPILGMGDQFSRASSRQILLPDNLLIETSIFCGKPMPPRFLCRPEQEQEVKQFLGLV